MKLNDQPILACPECVTIDKRELVERDVGIYPVEHFLDCQNCGQVAEVIEGIPVFSKSPSNKRIYAFEKMRYDNIALDKPKSWGLDKTFPDTRAMFFKEALVDVKDYLNIGAGFGAVEEKMPLKNKFCLDQSIRFLHLLQRRALPNINFIGGYAERMPLKSGIFSAVVSDSVFQTVVDQQEFLVENVRVLKKGGVFLLATAYKWNYPRKPQEFPVKNPSLLKHYLHELGIKCKIHFIDLESTNYCTQKQGDYMFLVGTKER